MFWVYTHAIMIGVYFKEVDWEIVLNGVED